VFEAKDDEIVFDPLIGTDELPRTIFAVVIDSQDRLAVLHNLTRGIDGEVGRIVEGPVCHELNRLELCGRQNAK
jgi:hypothetical protein